jgi:hypothetical protein
MGVTGPMLLGRPHRYRTMWSMSRPIPALRGHRARLEIAACGGADESIARSAPPGAAAPLPRGHTAPDAPNPQTTVRKATRRSVCHGHGLDPTERPSRSDPGRGRKGRRWPADRVDGMSRGSFVDPAGRAASPNVKLLRRTLPYQQITGNRWAKRRSCRLPPTVDAEVKCSLGVQLSALFWLVPRGST